MDDLKYNPDEILDAEIRLEILPEAHSAPLLCVNCDREMRAVEATRKVAGGRFFIPYQIFTCEECGRRGLNPEQASRFGAILRLDKMIEEKGDHAAGDVLFDGRDVFLRLPFARELFSTVEQAHAKAS